MMKKAFFKDGDIKKSICIVVGILAIVIKIVLVNSQLATIYPPLAPIDDDLMFKAAESIVAGNWLGEYSFLTISKHMFFSLWLAFVHKSGISLLVANMLLWIMASFALVKAIGVAISKNWQKLIVFIFLVYNPAMSAQYATRIYRDSIFPSLCLFFFAGIIGVGLRYKKNIKSWVPYLLMYGISFGCIYLCREDGVWVLPFFVVAFIIVIALTMKEKYGNILKKSISMLAPFIISLGIIFSYCYMNYTHYGRFIVSDFTSSEFKSAYGALTSIKQDNWNKIVAVPESVRKEVSEKIPMFKEVYDELKDKDVKNSYMNPEIGDYMSGAFYWAFRNSVSNLGYYETPQKAQEYYEKLTEEIQNAVDNGQLLTENGSKKLRKSITPPIKMDYVPDVLKETFNGFKTVILFEQCNPLAEAAVGTAEEIEKVENFIHVKGGTVLWEGTDTPYLLPNDTLKHTILETGAFMYKIIIPVMFVLAFIWQIKKFIFDISIRKLDVDSMLNIVMLGLLGMALLRCAMIAFVEVSSFGIGTYIMYLSTVHPLIIAYSVIGFCKNFDF